MPVMLESGQAEPPTDVQAAPERRRNHVELGLLLAVVLALGVITMPRFVYYGDPTVYREEARSVVLGEGMQVSPAVVSEMEGNGRYYVQNPRDGTWHSKYGVLNTLMNVPPLALERLVTGELPPYESPSRVLFLNLWNIVLTLVLTWLLHALGAHFTPRRMARVVYVLAVLFGTFVWNYLRAQTSELIQIILFTWAFLAWVRFVRRATSDSDAVPGLCGLGQVWLALSGLVFSRFSYLYLLPLVWLGVGHLYRRRAPGVARDWHARDWLALFGPFLLIVGLLGLSNASRFGEPWYSGYHVYYKGTGMGSLTEGGWGLLGLVPHSIPLHFPVLVLALFRLRRFWSRFPFEAAGLVVVGVAAYGFNAAIPNWDAQWCYGPRYMVFVLPVVGLPFVSLLEDVAQAGRWRWPASAAIALVLLYSTFWQVQVNRMHFFTYFLMREPFDTFSSTKTSAYFLEHHFGRINLDLARARGNFDELPYFRELKRRVRPDLVERYRKQVLEQYGNNLNYFWF